MVAEPWPGVDPSWSRTLRVPSTASVDPAGTVHRWHLLDNGAELTERGLEPAGTLLCVHGNPTWSYLWRTLLAAGTAAGSAPWRVIAVDQLDMGFSARTGSLRRLPVRITDLGDLTRTLDLQGPVVTVGHDWGGVISLGWALAHRDQLAGIVLTNTAVHHDPGKPIPAALRLALHPAVHGWGTTTTSAFLGVTHALAHPPLAKDVAAALMAPYRTARRRAGVGNFVADIPADAAHPSFGALRAVAEGIRDLDVPALLLWGPRDPIFSDRYLRDLVERLPAAKVHRFEGAGHLLAEDVNVAGAVFDWLGDNAAGSRNTASTGGDTESTNAAQGPDSYVPMWAELVRRAQETSPAVVDMAPLSRTADATGAAPAVMSWAQLADEVSRLAQGLTAIGVRPGHRISLLVPPGSELTSLIYACLRVGAVIVLADAGLGARGLNRAIQGAGPDFVIGIERALTAARLFGWPGVRISAQPLSAAKRALYSVRSSLAELPGGTSPAAGATMTAAGAATPAGGPTTAAGPFPADHLPPEPDPDSPAAVLFTSGSTGPAKGVLYTHRRLSAMRAALAASYGLTSGTALVAGFAPFALLGPALGATSVTPDMDVTAPKTLTATALAAAAAAVSATAVFVSPAALRNVLATTAQLGPGDRDALAHVTLLLSAGAPVPASLLDAASDLVPNAKLHTPYGMTEALPVTDIELGQIHAAETDAGAENVVGAGNGVCVGIPVPGAAVVVSPLDVEGRASGDLTSAPAITGEILVRAAHVKETYDRLWLTERSSARNPGWHRTGDVGHLDAKGRLWVEGRLAHILSTPNGILTPVHLEQRVESVPGVDRAAVVGVGPVGNQVVVAVVETSPGTARPSLAAPELTEQIRRAVANARIAAVLVVRELPTDIRHNAKVDRARIAAWAKRVLAGGRMGTP
ncbi:alpha/beta fold hydrolase [Paenarthrobacter sp. Z7-10]|uniref:alpha/beta fold hydrolase n=1 Tax=Paenarthrobacter sp. Z7-10 TaxID=2787635 RepID=UPI0022A9BD46|nr:alpha/beta fold hydrolase [Paenarthrobacter sp. Z7-10]MCZ2403475.1 alpha/beta fold hydrolase [Paenarthrobacter sp. Z7-10]